MGEHEPPWTANEKAAVALLAQMPMAATPQEPAWIAVVEQNEGGQIVDAIRAAMIAAPEGITAFAEGERRRGLAVMVVRTGSGVRYIRIVDENAAGGRMTTTFRRVAG